MNCYRSTDTVLFQLLTLTVYIMISSPGLHASPIALFDLRPERDYPGKRPEEPSHHHIDDIRNHHQHTDITSRMDDYIPYDYPLYEDALDDSTEDYEEFIDIEPFQRGVMEVEEGNRRVSEILQDMKDIQSILLDSYEGQVVFKKASQIKNSPGSEQLFFYRNRIGRELDEQSASKKEFVCNLDDYFESCNSQSALDLEVHIQTLVEDNIYRLKKHVLDITENMEGLLGSQRYPYATAPPCVANFYQNDTFYIGEESVLTKAHSDLISIACHLHRAKQWQEQRGEDYATEMEDILRNYDYDIPRVLCDLRLWMDEVNVTIEDTAEAMKGVEAIECQLSDRQSQRRSVRREWDRLLLNVLVDYLDTLKRDVRLVQELRNIETRDNKRARIRSIFEYLDL